MKQIIQTTESLCPVCLKKVKAIIWTEKDESYMEKSCPEHGRFKALLWRGSVPLKSWLRNKKPAKIKKPMTPIKKGCPYDCGLCADHRQNTCTALIEVTQRCNLNCQFCFADAGGSGQDIAMETIKGMYQSVMDVSGNCNIQLSGGEPTLRDDLPEIISLGHRVGFSFIQINSNGIRLGEDEDYVKKLKEAGLDSVFLQFDGTQDEIHQKLRRKPLQVVKVKALENCRKNGIGIVLVPTLVRGVNDHHLGSLIDFAREWMPTVRGIHIQPASYFGRIPDRPVEKNRLTLGDIMDEIDRQTEGRIGKASFAPPGCENARCSFHGNYMLGKDNEWTPLKSQSKCCGNETAEEGANKAKAHVSRQWSGSNACCSAETDAENKPKDSWDHVLEEIKTQSFSLSAMAFQDVWNIDLNRVKDCCIHVVNTSGQLIPFCMYNLTDQKGRSIYRSQ